MSTETRPPYTTAVRIQDPAKGIDWTEGYVSSDLARCIADARRDDGFTVTVEHFDRQRLTHPTALATEAELRLARAAGRRAYAADRPAAPGIDAEVLRLIGTDAPVGQPRTVAIMAAFSSAYRALADRAAEEVLTA